MSFETPPRPRWILRISLAVGTVLVLVLGVVVVIGFVQRCAAGVWHQGEDGECVGVTDGSFSYFDGLDVVSDKIEKANRDAARATQHVTIAVLMPMTAKDDDSLSADQIKEYLQGAYVAQRNANADPNGLGIQLVLANEGRDEHAWEQVTDRLLEMADGPENLVAVTGLGLSTPETVKGANKLGGAGIPMVGYLSADGFNRTSEAFDEPMPNLTRVTPSLADELDAVAAYLDEDGGKPSKALLVSDESPKDYYTVDLRADFEERFNEAWTAGGRGVSPFTGGHEPYNLTTRFADIARRLCDDRELDTVLYAGRSNLLDKFVEHVRTGGCTRDRSITIVTGSESTDLDIKPRQGSAPFSVLYASVSDPAALNHAGNNHRQLYTDFANALHHEFDPETDESNWSVMGHDATLTAATAAQRSVGQDDEVLPSVTDVRDNLIGLNYDAKNIGGASGWFRFDDNGDRVSGGVPVLERDESGNVTVHDLGGLDD